MGTTHWTGNTSERFTRNNSNGYRKTANGNQTQDHHVVSAKKLHLLVATLQNVYIFQFPPTVWTDDHLYVYYG